MTHILRQYGYSFIFLTVFAESLGLPLPSYPVILLAAALTVPLGLRTSVIFAICVLCALVGDGIWFQLGRLRGRPILRRLCSLSLSPDSCVSRTESVFQRYGVKSLFVSKFIPGLGAVAAPLAGMLKVSCPRFLAADLAGIVLWAGSAIVLGQTFSAQVEWVIDWIAAFRRTGVLMALVLAAAWVVLKWIQRTQFYRMLERSRISPPELKERMERGEAVVIIDLRSDIGYHADGVKIPGALWIPPHEFEERFREIPQGRPVVMYCTCPNEVTSAKMARLLVNKGYREVSPLLRGLDGWLELGYPTEPVFVASPTVDSITPLAKPTQSPTLEIAADAAKCGPS